MPPNNQRRTLLDWLGLKDPRAYPPAFGHFLGFLLTLILLSFAVLFLMAFAASIFLVFGVFTDAGSSLGVSALLVALLGAPFLIWRTLVAQRTLDETKRQTDLQDEAAFNDKINAAAKDLAARRQVTKIVQQDGKDVVLTEWQDDLVTRAAAIDRLEGLAIEAIDREDYAPAQRIARMLSIYVQELSRTQTVELVPEHTTERSLSDWFFRINTKKRPDTERAVQSLGRINPRDERRRDRFNSANIDLQGCNLQGFDLERLNFHGAKFNRAWLSCAFLVDVELQQAEMNFAQMQGVRLLRVDLRDAKANGANIQGGQLVSVNMNGTNLERVNFSGSEMTGTKFSKTTILEQSEFLGVSIWRPDEATLENLRPFWESLLVFSWALPDNHPRHWVTTGKTFGFLDMIHLWRDFAATFDPPIVISHDYRKLRD